MVTNNKGSTFLHAQATLYCLCMIAGFRQEVAENCTLLGYYAASNGNFLLQLQYGVYMGKRVGGESLSSAVWANRVPTTLLM